MKGKICFYPLFLLIILIFCSCNNEIFDESNIENKSSINKSGEIFTVAPNGVDDTQNIRDAFADAKAAGSGNTVYLSEGVFYTGLLIIEDFDGYFMGAGKGNTTIISLTGLPCADMMTQEMVPALITFSTGFPKISDMTIDIVESPCQLYQNPWGANQIQNLIATMLIGPHAIDESFDCSGEVPEVEEGHSSIDNVEFKVSGQNETTYYHISIGGYTQINDANCYGWFKTLKGNHTVTNCDFYGANVTGVDIFQLVDSKVIIGGSPNNGNNFYTFMAMDALDNDNTQIEVSYNVMESPIGINNLGGLNFIFYGIQYIPLSNYHIHHNKIMPEWFAIANDDFGLFADIKTLNVVIEQNEFIMDGSNGAIQGWLTQDVLVRNNRFSGTSDLGIYLGYDGFTCSNWTILGNNFNKLTTSFYPIWLGPDAEDCTVVGGNNKVNVLDEGSNNILTGVNNQGNPPGPEIKEALAARRELIKSRRY